MAPDAGAEPAAGPSGSGDAAGSGDTARSGDAADGGGDAADSGGSGGAAAGTSGGGREAGDPRLAALLAAGRDRSSPIYKAAARIQASFRGHVVRKAYQLYKVSSQVTPLDGQRVSILCT